MMRIATLTPRQADVLAELAEDGASNLEIANRLCIDVETVKTHMRAISEATGIKGRTRLALAYERDQIALRVVEKRK